MVDSGCPKSVAGKLWVNLYKQSVMNMEEFKDFDFKEYDEKEDFKFGPSQVYTSHKAITLPVKIGIRTTSIIVSQVNANIPLLLGRDYLKEWKCNMNFENNTLRMDDFVVIELQVNDKEHYTLDLIDANIEVARTFNETFFLENSDKEKFEKINKIHKITAHKQQDQLIRFLKNHRDYDKSIDKIVSEVVKKCPTCNIFKKPLDKPKFQTGDKVFVKSKDKEIWEGPLQVNNHGRDEVIVEKDNVHKKTQEEDNMNVLYYTEHTDKEQEEEDDEILIIKVPKDSVRDLNHIIKDSVSKGEIEKFIWVDNKLDVLLSRKNCDMNIETRKDEVGEDCQSLSFISSHNDLYKPCNNNHIHSFQ